MLFGFVGLSSIFSRFFMENGESFAGWRASWVSESAITVYCPTGITIKSWKKILNRSKGFSGVKVRAKIVRIRWRENSESRVKLCPASPPREWSAWERRDHWVRLAPDRSDEIKMPSELKRAQSLLLDRYNSKWDLRWNRVGVWQEWTPKKKAAREFWLRAQQYAPTCQPIR